MVKTMFSNWQIAIEDAEPEDGFSLTATAIVCMH